MPIAPRLSQAAASPWGAGLYGLKPAFVSRLRRIEDLAAAHGVSPDAVTLAGVGVGLLSAAAVAAGARWPLVWLAVAPLSMLRMACNAVDGSLARRQASSSRRGSVLNELGDRIADLATFLALAPAVGIGLAAAAALVALSTSFVAVVGAAIAGERLTQGPLGKPDRVAVLSVAAAAAAFTGPSALVIGAWTLVVAGSLTTVRRTHALWQRAGETS